MPEQIEIADDKLAGFSAQARTRLKDAVAEYATDLIEEANRIEAGRNSTTGPPEVTRGMVIDAKDLLRRGLGVPKKRWGFKILRVVAVILSLVVGIMYNETALQDSGYLLLFILVVAAAILAVTLSTLRE